jgi:spore germination protein KC
MIPGLAILMSGINPMEAFSAKAIRDSLKMASLYYGEPTMINYNDFLKDYLNEGIENVVNSIYLDSNTLITLGNIGVMKKDKLLGWLTVDESFGYNFIMNKITNAIINIPCDNNYIGIEIKNTTGSINTSLKDNNLMGSIKIKGNASISEMNCSMNLENEKNISEIKKKTENKIKEMIKNTLKTAQIKYKSDIFGFGKKLKQYNYSYWKKIKNNWNNIFSKLDIKIDASISIIEEGAIVNTIKQR